MKRLQTYEIVAKLFDLSDRAQLVLRKLMETDDIRANDPALISAAALARVYERLEGIEQRIANIETEIKNG